MDATTVRRRRSGGVADDLLDAALVEFAAHGYDGASTRAIARRAGWHQPQINYHFDSKDQLWRAAVDRLFAELAEAVGAAAAPSAAADLSPDDLSPDELLAAFTARVRHFVGFSARRPELHRIMNLESTADSGRLAWIVQRHVGPLHDLVVDAWSRLRAAGRGAELDGDDVFELVVGFGALPFANAPMHRLLTGRELGPGPAAEAHADRLLALLFPEPALLSVPAGERTPSRRPRRPAREAT